MLRLSASAMCGFWMHLSVLCSLPCVWPLRRAFNCVIAAYASRPRSGLVVSCGFNVWLVSTCGFRWLSYVCFFDLMWLLILMSEDPSLNPSTQHQEAQLTLTTFHPQTLAASPTLYPQPLTHPPPPPPPPVTYFWGRVYTMHYSLHHMWYVHSNSYMYHCATPWPKTC